MINVIINGSKGRMGQALLTCAKLIPDLEVVGAVDAGDDLAALLPSCDVVIDFSFHEVTLSLLNSVSLSKKPLSSALRVTVTKKKHVSSSVRKKFL